MLGLRVVRNILWVMGAAVFLAGVNGESVRAGNPQALLTAEGKAPHAIITTKFGEMELVFFPQLAPKHVESFLNLAKKGLRISGPDTFPIDSRQENRGTHAPNLSLIHI